jgi:hypothetical protein
MKKIRHGVFFDALGDDKKGALHGDILRPQRAA